MNKPSSTRHADNQVIAGELADEALDEACGGSGWISDELENDPRAQEMLTDMMMGIKGAAIFRVVRSLF